MGNVWKYVLPAMLSHVCFSLFSIVDGVFVGNGVGTNAIGTIGLVIPFVNAICAIMMLINVGVSAIFSIAGVFFARPLFGADAVTADYTVKVIPCTPSVSSLWLLTL